MQKRTREIIALVLLVVLLIGGASAFVWYILVGHNWNATATSIDDRIGNMEGYTVILHEGAVPSLREQYEASASEPMLEEQNYGIADANTSSADADESADVEEAVASYVDKEAQVITVHTKDADFYKDAVVVPRNGKRMAIFSIDGPRADLAAKNVAKELRLQDVDFVICIIESLEAIERGIGSVDLAICTDYDSAGAGGRYVGRTFVVGSPYEGEVSAVVMSPSGFLSTKMLYGS